MSASLRAYLRDMEPALLETLRCLLPGVADTSTLHIRRLGEDSSHVIALLASRTEPDVRIILKARPPHSRLSQDLGVEAALYRDIAPKVWATNSATRCPEFLAYLPDPGVLFLEAVEGSRLDHALFHLGHNSVSQPLPYLIELAAEWLAHFHTHTTLATTAPLGGPFETLAELFLEEHVHRVFLRHGSPELYKRVRRVVDMLARRYHDFQIPACMVHGEFAPYHVLIADRRIYVIDLASSHRGYPYQDVAYFTTFYDALLPWRRVIGEWRLPFRGQTDLFLRTYFAMTGPPPEPMMVALRLARIHAMTIYARQLEAEGTWKRQIYSQVARRLLGSRFRTLCYTELDALSMHSLP